MDGLLNLNAHFHIFLITKKINSDHPVYYNKITITHLHVCLL